MRVLWNKETNKKAAKGDKVYSFRNETWTLEGWSGITGKVFARDAGPKAFQRELYVTVFPALEWREDA